MEQDWDLMWGDKEWMKEVFDTLHLSEFQRCNHFRNHFEVISDVSSISSYHILAN